MKTRRERQPSPFVIYTPNELLLYSVASWQKPNHTSYKLLHLSHPTDRRTRDMASEISDIQVFHHLKRNNEENMLKVVSFLSLSLSLSFLCILKKKFVSLARM